jgi:hypothetical protein
LGTGRNGNLKIPEGLLETLRVYHRNFNPN